MKTHLLPVTLACAAALAATQASQFNEATVTRAVNTVRILPPDASPKPASAGERIRGNDALQTGAASRAELTFPDNTLARLGANTLFSFNTGTRDVSLENGTILLEVPKGVGGATIRSAPVTAAITGTTIMMEYSPGNPGVVKLIVLEGSVRLSLNNRVGESVVVRAGQMIAIPDNATNMPDPVDVDLDRIIATSTLVNDGDLASMDRIQAGAAAQRRLLRRGILLETNYALREQNIPAVQSASVLRNLDQRRDTVPQPAPVAAPPPQPPPQPPPAQPPPPKPRPTPPNNNQGSGGSYYGSSVTVIGG